MYNPCKTTSKKTTNWKFREAKSSKLSAWEKFYLTHTWIKVVTQNEDSQTITQIPSRLLTVFPQNKSFRNLQQINSAQKIWGIFKETQTLRSCGVVKSEGILSCYVTGVTKFSQNLQITENKLDTCSLYSIRFCFQRSSILNFEDAILGRTVRSQKYSKSCCYILLLNCTCRKLTKLERVISTQ